MDAIVGDMLIDFFLNSCEALADAGKVGRDDAGEDI